MMMDMGRKEDKDRMLKASENSDSEIIYPHLYLDEKIPDEIMAKDVGHTCRLEIVGKIINKGFSESGDKTKKHIELEIHKMGYMSKSGEYTKDEKLKMKPDEREKVDKEEVMSKDEEEY